LANWEKIAGEFNYRTSRSSGPGGQHANKVETKVFVYFDIANSFFLDDQEKKLLLIKLTKRVNKKGLLFLYCDKKRKQIDNKILARKLIIMLMQKALKPVKSRKSTHPPKREKEKRLNKKKRHSELKQLRKKINF